MTAAIAGIIVLIIIALQRRGSEPIVGSEKLSAWTIPSSPSAIPSAHSPNVEDALTALDWFQLEQLVARLFEVKGCAVLTRGGAKADGGIDLIVQTESTKAAVQCKHWSKWKCGPAVIRELIGSMVHENLPQGFLICRSATEDAKALAASHRIRVIERSGLVDRINDAIAQNDGPTMTALFHPPKLCPKCSGKMVRRTAGKGSKRGSEFWGCSTYPKCQQVLKI